MATLTDEQRAAILSLLGIDAPASAPAPAVVASPYAGLRPVTVAGEATSTLPVSMRGLSRKDAKIAAAVHAEPGYSCSVDAVWLFNGENVTGAAHGYMTPRKAGDACPHPGKVPCSGVIR